MRCVKNRAINSVVAAVACCLLAGAASGADVRWQHDPNTAGNWQDPNNWTPSLPGAGDTAIIDNAGTAQISGGSIRVTEVVAGDALAGSITQSGGTSVVGNVAGDALHLGKGFGATGSYTLSGGSLSATSERVGYYGTGRFIQSGGTNTVGGMLRLGYSSGSAGTYDLGGGSVSASAVYVGNSGAGTFTQSGGTNSVSNILYLGYETGSAGTYNLIDGLVASTSQYVARSGGGTFKQSGGTNRISGALYLGFSTGAAGTYQLSGGFTGSRDLYVGYSGTGSFSQSGGTNSVSYTLTLGQDASSAGTYCLSAGSLTTASQYVGRNGPGTFKQSGGINAPLGTVYVGYLGPVSGRYELTGGTLAVGTGMVAVGLEGAGTFVATGGTAAAGKISLVRGLVEVGTEALVTVPKIELANSAGAVTTMRFQLGSGRSAAIRGDGSPTSSVTIGAAGDHTLDIQANAYRPREGQKFYVFTNFASITGLFDQVTTNITLGQRNDPNTGLPMPFFAAGAVSDPNDPNMKALAVTFQGLTAGDTNGDHKVDTTDLNAMAAAWFRSGTWGWANGNFSGDAAVDTSDLNAMTANWWWTKPSPAPDQPIPEPGTLALLSLGGLALIGRRRRAL